MLACLQAAQQRLQAVHERNNEIGERLTETRSEAAALSAALAESRAEVGQLTKQAQLEHDQAQARASEQLEMVRV